ncbi:MAG: hypothetical protein ACC700_14850 [Anaerolineales bacterium]
MIDPGLVWTGERWEWEQPPTQEKGPSYLETLLAGDHGDYWKRLTSTQTVLVNVPSTGFTEELDLGPEMEEYAIVFEGEPRGWTVARLRSPDRRVFLLPYKDDPRESQWFEIEFQDLPPMEYRDLADYTRRSRRLALCFGARARAL